MGEVGECEHEGRGDHRNAEAPDDEGFERVEEPWVAQEVEDALAGEGIAGDRGGQVLRQRSPVHSCHSSAHSHGVDVSGRLDSLCAERCDGLQVVLCLRDALLDLALDEGGLVAGGGG